MSEAFEERVRAGLAAVADGYAPSPGLRRAVDRRVRRHRRGRVATAVVGTVGALVFLAGLGVLLATDDDGSQNESLAATTIPVPVDPASAEQLASGLLSELNVLRLRTEPTGSDLPPTLARIAADASPEVQAAIAERVAYEDRLQPLSADAGTTYVDSTTAVEVQSIERLPGGGLRLEVVEEQMFTIENGGLQFPSIGRIPHVFEVGVGHGGGIRIESWHEVTLVDVDAD